LRNCHNPLLGGSGLALGLRTAILRSQSAGPRGAAAPQPGQAQGRAAGREFQKIIVDSSKNAGGTGVVAELHLLPPVCGVLRAELVQWKVRQRRYGPTRTVLSAPRGRVRGPRRMIRVARTLYGRRRRLRSRLRTFEDDPDIPVVPDRTRRVAGCRGVGSMPSVPSTNAASRAWRGFRAISQAGQSTLTHSSGSLAQLPEKTSAAPTEGSLPLAVLRWGAHWILSLGRNVGR
jgi:hypothetical protein